MILRDYTTLIGMIYQITLESLLEMNRDNRDSRKVR